MTRRDFTGAALLAANAIAQQPSTAKPVRGKLRAGASCTNITPPLGAALAGNYTEDRSTENHDELWVKSLVLDNGGTRVALCVVDTCVLPASVNQKAKQLIESEAEVPAGNVLFCCTHTHSAPATMHLFQAQPSEAYLEFLTRRIADSVRMSVARLQPARLGFGFGQESRIAFNRRYEMKPGSVPPNPFGGIDRVRTNPGIGNPNVIRPVGPIDPTVGVLSVQTEAGKPLGLVGNYSLHYVGGVRPGHVSADYFAHWAAKMTRRMGVSVGPGESSFVAMLTNGAQGDINNINVLGGKAEREPPYVKMAQVAGVLADESARVLASIRYSDTVELGASQEWLTLNVRLPTADEVQTARKLLGNAPLLNVPRDKQFREMPLVYARETVIMAETFPKQEQAPVQALRIGDVGLCAFAGEPFVELGLEVRKKSPFRQNFLLGLSNHHIGYLPTAAAFEQGGYETWRAKTSYLEKEAGAKMVAAMLRRLESLAG